MGKLLDALISITTRPPQQFVSARGSSLDLATNGFEFVAMEYFGLILNHTLLIKVTDKGIIGIKASGPIAAPRVVTEAMYDPEFYVPEKRRTLLRSELDGMSGKLMDGGARFAYPWKEIREVTFNVNAKWGMGTVPYSGRIVLRRHDGSSREFILLGRQDGLSLLAGAEALRNRN